MTYGTGTRSYNRSAEKRESDRQRAAATAAHEMRPRGTVVEVPTGCPCCRFVVCIYRGRPMSATSRDWEPEPWKRLLFGKSS